MTAANFRGRDEARAKLKQAAIRYPDEANAHVVYGNFLLNHFKEEGCAEAVREFEQAAVDSTCTAAHFELLRAYTCWGEESQEQDPAAAIERFTRALKYAVTKSEHVKVLTNRSLAARIAHKLFGKSGYLADALVDSNVAIQLDPNDAIAYMERGLAKVQAGEEPAAEVDFKRCLELKPDYAPQLEHFKRVARGQ